MPATPPKIADALPNANDILGDRFSTACTDDGKLWFVSRKGVSQPSISYFHETPLQGGNLVFFDTHSKSWSKPAPFGSISEEELLEGHVFGHKNRLFLLTYRGSGTFAFQSLYEWKDNEWRKVDHFDVDEKTKFDCGDRADMKTVVDDSGNVYFVADKRFGLGINKFQLSEDGKQASVMLSFDTAPAFPLNAHGARLVRAAISGHHLYGIYGQQGCGFRWDPTHPFKIDLQTGNVEHLEAGSEIVGQPGACPPWSFSGAYAGHLVPPSKWFFLGGCRAKGLSSTEDDASIWILDLEKKDWRRFEAFDLPQGARFVGAFGSPTKFYVVNVNSGVYELDPSKA